MRVNIYLQFIAIIVACVNFTACSTQNNYNYKKHYSSYKKINTRKTTNINTNIMGYGKALAEQLQKMLQKNNPNLAISYIKNIANIYITEARDEGVNHDVAFVQMCHETNFLRFGGQVKKWQNNFAGIGALDGGARGAKFKSARIGVRAQIQHLKAYASYKALNKPLVDPRFKYVKRGSVTNIYALAKKWASDRHYGSKLHAKLRLLYSL